MRFFFYCFVFFFQAEDGIRDLVRSRGLGDVYKRQGLHDPVDHAGVEAQHEVVLQRQVEPRLPRVTLTTVSYTHLTLPTIYSV